MNDKLAQFLSTPENKNFMNKVLEETTLAGLLAKDVTVEYVTTAIKETTKAMRKRHGTHRRGSQFVDLYPGEIDLNDSDSKKELIKFLKDKFTESLTALNNLKGALAEQAEKAEAAKAEALANGTQKDTGQDSKPSIDMKKFTIEAKRGLRTLFKVSEDLSKNLRKAFYQAENTLFPSDLHKYDAETKKHYLSPSAEAREVIKGYNDTFTTIAKGHLSEHDLDFLFDFYGAMAKHPEKAAERFPALKHVELGGVIAALNNLIDKILVKKSLSSVPKDLLPKSPAQNKGELDKDFIERRKAWNSDEGKEKIRNMIAEKIQGVIDDANQNEKKYVNTNGTIKYGASPWIPVAIKLSPAVVFTGGLIKGLSAHPIDTPEKFSKLEAIVTKLLTEPFGKNGMGRLDADLEKMENEVLRTLKSYQTSLVGVMKDVEEKEKEQEASTLEKKPISNLVYDEHGSNSYTNNRAVGSHRKFLSDFSGTPSEYADLPHPDEIADRTAIAREVDQTLLKTFPLPDVARVLTLKDIGDDQTTSKREDPIEALKDNLGKAYETISHADTDKLTELADTFSDASSNSPVSVIKGDLVTIKSKISSVEENMGKLNNLYDLEMPLITKPFGEVKEIPEGITQQERIAIRKQNRNPETYKHLYEKSLISLSKAFKEAIDLNPNSPDFLTMNTSVAKAPLASLEDVSTVLPKHTPDNLKDSQFPWNTEEHKSALSALAKLKDKSDSLINVLYADLSSVREAYMGIKITLKEHLEPIKKLKHIESGEKLLAAYKLTIEDKSRRAILTGSNIVPSHVEMGEITKKTAATVKPKPKPKGPTDFMGATINKLVADMGRIQEVSGGALIDLKKNPVYHALADFIQSAESIGWAHNIASLLIPSLTANTSYKEFGDFVKDYNELTSIFSVVEGLPEKLDSIGKVLAEHLSTVLGISQAKRESVSKLVRTASELTTKGNYIAAAGLLKTAGRGFGKITDPKDIAEEKEKNLKKKEDQKKDMANGDYLSLSTSVPKDLKNFEKIMQDNIDTYKKVSKLLIESVAKVSTHPKDPVDYTKIDEATKELKGLKVSKDVNKFTPKSTYIKQQLDKATELDLNGVASDLSNNLSSLQDNRAVTAIHQALKLVVNDMSRVRMILGETRKKCDQDLEEINTFIEHSDDASTLIEAIKKDLKKDIVHVSAIKTLTSGKFGKFLRTRGAGIKASTLEDFRNLVSSVPHEDVDGDKISLKTLTTSSVDNLKGRINGLAEKLKEKKKEAISEVSNNPGSSAVLLEILGEDKELAKEFLDDTSNITYNEVERVMNKLEAMFTKHKDNVTKVIEAKDYDAELHKAMGEKSDNFIACKKMLLSYLKILDPQTSVDLATSEKKIRDYVYVLDTAIKELKKQDNAAKKRSKDIEAESVKLALSNDKIPQRDSSLEEFRKKTLINGERDKTGDMPGLGLSVNHFSKAYEGAYNAATKSVMHRAVINLETEGKNTASNLVQSWLEDEVPAKGLVSKYQDLIDKGRPIRTDKKATAAYMAEKTALITVLRNWPDKNISWAMKKLAPASEGGLAEVNTNNNQGILHAVKDTIVAGLDRYMQGEEDTLNDAISAVSLTKHPRDIEVREAVSTVTKDIPKDSGLHGITRLEDDLHDTVKDPVNYKKLLRSTGTRKEFVKKSEKARDILNSLHPAKEKTNAHEIAAKVLADYGHRSEGSLKDAVDKALREEIVNTKAGDKATTEKQVKHAILDMASTGDEHSYASAKILVTDGWNKSDHTNSEDNSDPLSTVKHTALHYRNNTRPDRGNKVHERLQSALRTNTNAFKEKEKLKEEGGNDDASALLAREKSRIESDAHASRLHTEGLLQDYSSTMLDKLHKLSKEQASLTDEDKGTSHARNIENNIDTLTHKLNTYYGHKAGGILGDHKELAEEAFEHYTSKAQKGEDDAHTFAKFRQQKALAIPTGKSENKKAKELAKERAEALAEQYGYSMETTPEEDTKQFNNFIEGATKAYRDAGNVGSLIGRKPVLKGSGQDHAGKNKYFSGGQGGGLGDFDMGSISTDLGGGTHKYVNEQAQTLLTNWVNHLKISGATNFHDNGGFMKMMDEAMKKLAVQVRRSYSAESIEGYEIEGVKYPGVLDNLKKERAKWIAVLKNSKDNDKKVTEAKQALMEILAKIIKDNDAKAGESEEAVNKVHETYDKVHKEQKDRLDSKKLRLVSSNGLQSTVRLNGEDGTIDQLHDSLNASLAVNDMPEKDYSKLVAGIRQKLVEGSKGKAVKFTNRESVVIGPDLLAELEKDPEAGASKALTKGSDRFRDYQEEVRVLLVKLSFFEGAPGDINDGIKYGKAPAFSSREKQLMGQKLTKYIQDILNGSKSGDGVRINSAAAKKALGHRSYADTIKKKTDKLIKDNHEQITKTVKGEKSLIEVRALHDLMPELTRVVEGHEIALRELKVSLSQKELTQEDYDTLMGQELTKYQKSFNRVIDRKPDLRRDFVKKLRNELGEKPTVDNIHRIEGMLDKTFSRVNGVISPEDRKDVSELMKTLEDIKEIDRKVKVDPTSIQNAEEEKARLKSRAVKGYKKLSESDHPSLKSLSDLAIHHSQTNQANKDEAALKRVQEWLETSAGAKFENTPDFTEIKKNPSLMKDFKQISGLHTKSSDAIRKSLTVAIESQLQPLRLANYKIRGSSATEEDYKNFINVFDTVDNLLYANLSDYFTAASNRIYREAKEIARKPFINSLLLKDRILSTFRGQENVPGGFYNNYYHATKLIDNDKLKKEDQEDLATKAKGLFLTLERNIVHFLNSDPDATNLLNNKDIVEYKKFESNYPGLINEDVSEALNKRISKARAANTSTNIENLLNQLTKVDTSSSKSVFPNFDHLSKLRAVNMKLANELKNLKKNNGPEELMGKVEIAIANSSENQIPLFQRELNKAVNLYLTYAGKVSSIKKDEALSLKKTAMAALTKVREELNLLPGKSELLIPISFSNSLSDSMGNNSGGSEKISPNTLFKLLGTALGKANSLYRAIHATEELPASKETSALTKTASGSDDAGVHGNEDWLESSVSKNYIGDQKIYKPEDSESVGDHKDIIESKRAFKALKRGVDKIIKYKGKGKLLDEVRTDALPEDSMLGAARKIKDAVTHWHTNTGMTRDTGDDNLEELAAQYKAVDRHELKHGNNISRDQQRMLDEIKNRWNKLGGNLKRNEGILSKQIDSLDGLDGDPDVVKFLGYLKEKHNDAKSRLAEHTLITKEKSNHIANDIQQMLVELHTTSLDIEKRMNSFIKIVEEDGTESTLQATDALAQLEEVVNELTRSQAKKRAVQENSKKIIDRVDDDIQNWQRMLSYAKKNEGNGLSPVEEERWTRELMAQVMHWVMWVWNRNSDKFESAFNATDADYEKISQGIQDKVGLFNNPRVNKIMMQLTNMIDELKEVSYNALTAKQKKLLRMLKNERSRLYMYKYSLANIIGVKESVEEWGEKHGIDLKSSEEKEINNAIKDTTSHCSTLVANTAAMLQSTAVTLEGLDKKEKVGNPEIVKAAAKFSSLSNGSLTATNLTRMFKKFTGGDK